MRWVGTLLTLLCLVSGTLFLTALFGCDRGSPVRIGFSGQLVGEYADLGVAGRNGAMLAVEQINARGGIAGRKLELVARNDGDTDASAQQADRELLDAGVVGIVGHMTSGQTVAALPVTREKNVPLVSPTTSTPKLAGLIDNFFRVQVTTNYNASGLAIYCYERLGLRRIAMLLDTSNQAYIQAFAHSFAHAFTTAGGEIVARLRLDASSMPDWQQLLREAMKSDPDSLCIAAPATATAMLAQHGKLMGLQLPLIGSGLARTATLLEQGGRSVEGLYMTNSIDANSQGFKDFAARYEERFGRKPLFAAARGYEAAMLLAAGLERTGGKAEGLVEALQQIRSLQGVDTEVRLDRFGDCRRPSFVLQVKNGAFVNIDSIDHGTLQ